MQIDYKNIYYPPGGILLWFVIILELITFGFGIIGMVYYGTQEPVLFHESKMQLNVTFGTINTVLLLTSGFFMANTVHVLKQNEKAKAQKYLLLTMLLGVLFLILKSIEYYAKIDAGLVLGYNTFFTFYWILTLFHLLHVLIGLVILGSIYSKLVRGKTEQKIEDVEASAALWHMCDLIWLLLFPIIYLIF